jgi:FtsZ-interacting cell division protein ZipA
MDQHQLTIIVASIAILIVVAIIGFLIVRKRRSQMLRQRFGPEYDRVVKKEGDVHRGEDVLQFLTKRREKLQIRALSPSNRSDFASRWTTVQSQFVDDPKGAVSRADQLVNEVMQVRGYPIGDFDQRAADISVDHPVVVENYRAGHEIALRHNRGQASTEDLRKAMVHYRSLFDELLEEDSLPERKEARG